MRSHRLKLNSRRGFSLTELLVAILILSMVSAVVAGGIPVAKDAYEKVTVSANAQVMLSTAISALKNELCTASDVKVGSISASGIFTEGTKDAATGVVKGTTIRYYSPSIQNYSTISLGKTTGDEINNILLTQYADYTTDTSNKRRLVTRSAGDTILYVTYKDISYDESKSIVSFSELKVVDKTKTYAELDSSNNKIDIKLIS